MVPEPEKIEEFESLEDEENQDQGARLDEVSAGPVAEGSEGTEDKEEELEPFIDEAPEMMFSQDKQQTEGSALSKYCLFCREIIPLDATTCKHCGHVLHIFEGKVFKQLYWFFWGGIITFIGCLLPFYAGPELELLSSTSASFAGSLYLIISLLLIAAMGMSIYSRRLIMSPVFLMFIPAWHSWWTVVKIMPQTEHSWYEAFYSIDALNALTGRVGSGMMLILLGSTIIVVTFLSSFVSALAGGGKEKSGSESRGGQKGSGKGRKARR